MLFAHVSYVSINLSLTLREEQSLRARFEILTAASMKMAVFWVVALCSLVEVYRRFRGTCCLHHQGDEI
jgi:hypothetical protein